MSRDKLIPVMKELIPKALCERVFIEELLKIGVKTRFALSIYMTARLATEPKGTLYLVGFNKKGKIVSEKDIHSRIIKVPCSSRETIERFYELNPCPYYAAARKGDDFEEGCEDEYMEEAEFIFEILYQFGAELTEYAKVFGHRSDLLSPNKDKHTFPP